MQGMISGQTMLSWPSLLFAKLSILLLYLRIFSLERRVRLYIYAGLVWTVCTYLPSLITASYLCLPHSGQTTAVSIINSCRNAVPWYITSASMAIILDIFIFILPIPILIRLKLSGRRRLGLLLVFLAAIL